MANGTRATLRQGRMSRGKSAGYPLEMRSKEASKIILIENI